jgi:hypothetical protein
VLPSPLRAKTPNAAQSIGQTALVLFIPARFRLSLRVAVHDAARGDEPLFGKAFD